MNKKKELIALKEQVTYHKIGTKNLFILPSLPTWIALSDEESIALYYFIEGFSEKNVINKLTSEGITEKDGIKIYNLLLNKLSKNGFYPLASKQFIPEKNDKYPTNIHLCLTRKCNLRCKHCYISAGKELSDELSLSKWEKGFSSLFNYIKNPEITISGGEPTEVQFLENLVKYLHDKSIISIFTNGQTNINHLIPYVNEVQVSLDGLSATTHDYIRGRRSFERVTEFIKNFENKKILTIALTVMYHNFDEIKSNLLEFIKKYNIDMKNVRLNASLEVEGRANRLSKEYKDFSYNRAIEIAEFIHSANNFDEMYSEIFYNKLNCGIGLSLGIDSNGEIYPCDEFVNKLGNILDDNLKSHLIRAVKINEETEINNMKYCQECDLRYICLGGCKAKNYQENGSYLIPVCTKKDKFIKYTKLAYNI